MIFLIVLPGWFLNHSTFFHPCQSVNAAESCEKMKKVDSLICYAETFLGKPYRYACADPRTGFDCSGFVYFVFAHQGIRVPRASREYEKAGTAVPLDSCRKGDILVFTGTNANLRRAGHVGIVISGLGEPITFIQSSSSKKQNGVIISTFADSPYYSKRFLKAIRVMD